MITPLVIAPGLRRSRLEPGRKAMAAQSLEGTPPGAATGGVSRAGNPSLTIRVQPRRCRSVGAIHGAVSSPLGTSGLARISRSPVLLYERGISRPPRNPRRAYDAEGCEIEPMMLAAMREHGIRLVGHNAGRSAAGMWGWVPHSAEKAALISVSRTQCSRPVCRHLTWY
jgi:hypothetical protein